MIVPYPQNQERALQMDTGFAPYARILINKDIKSFSCAGNIQNLKSKNPAHQVSILGDFIGLYHQGRFLTPQQGFEILSAATAEKEFENLVCRGIGVFWIVWQTENKISVYASLRGPGLFIDEGGQSIRLYSAEREFYQNHIHQGLDDFQSLHYLLHHFSFRSPFSTPIKGSKRMIGGQKFTFDGTSTAIAFYLPPAEIGIESRPDADDLDEFAKITEGLTQIHYDHYKTSRNLFEISGGIDSAFIFCAAAKLGLNITPIHDFKGTILAEYTERLCAWLGLPKPEYLQPQRVEEDFEAQLDTITTAFKTGLGMLGLGNMFWHPDLIKDRPLAIGGHGIGVSYQGHPFMFPRFGRMALRNWQIDNLHHKPKRYLYTNAFIESLGQAAPSLIRSTFGNALPRDAYAYLSNLAFSNKLPLATGSILPPALSSLEAEYRAQWEELCLGPVTSNNLDALKEDTLSPLETAQAMRLLRFATNVQSIALNMHNVNSAGLFNQQDTTMEGLFNNFLLRRDVTMNEVHHPKNLEFLYFEKITGKNYNRNFIPHNILKYQMFRFSAQNRAEQKHLQNKKENLARHPAYQDLLRRHADPDNSMLICGLSNPQIRDYVCDVYRETAENPSRNFMTGNNILNLEIFLKNLESF
jgi:hypothetical protein